jgi:hypothetical protein
METVNRENILFLITKNEIQEEAYRRTGRYLSEMEMNSFQKMLEWGLLNGIDTIFNAAFEEVVENRIK